jgi:hypothetical protein
MKQKLCNKCQQSFPATREYFHVESRKPDGFRESCKTCRLSYIQNWSSSEESKTKKAAYRKRTRQHIREYKRNWERNRAKTHPEFKIKQSLRKRLYTTLKHSIKSSSTMKLLGCSFEYFIAYLEGKFQDGMTLENYGTWHIDHIRPCCSFDLNNIEHQKQCFHYTNLQPLWAKDNLSKGGKII